MQFIKELKELEYVKENSPICKDLSGIELPLLTISTRVNMSNIAQVVLNEFIDTELPSY